MNGGKSHRVGKSGMKVALARYFATHPGHKRDKIRQANRKPSGQRRKVEHLWAENYIRLGSL